MGGHPVSQVVKKITFLYKKNIKLPPDGCFPGENRNFFDFRVNTPTSFPESGSRKCFHASGMRAIDSPIKLPLYGSFLVKKFSGPKNHALF